MELTSSGGAFTLSHTYVIAGVRTITVTATDDDDATTTDTITVTVSEPPNIAPQVQAGSATATVAEGATFSRSGTASDDDGIVASLTVDYGDGSGAQPLTLTSGSFTLSHTYVDDGARTVTVTATDDDGATATDAVSVTVTNVGPSITSTSGPTGSVTTGTPIEVAGTFTDPGVADSHTATIAWGDSATSTASVTQGAGSGSLRAAHTYSAAGVYTVTVSVNDGDGGTASATRSVTVTEPPAPTHGTSGAGKFKSPKRAYPAEPSLEGKAKLSFSVTETGTTRSGSVSFKYAGKKVRFSAAQVSALSLTSSRAQVTFVGTLNGKSGYVLVLTVVDGANTSAQGKDLVRVKITKANGRGLVYDNHKGASSIATPRTPLTSGNVSVY